MKWNGKGCLRGTKTRNQYHRGDTVPPEDVSKGRLEELRDNGSLIDVMPEDQAKANEAAAAEKAKLCKNMSVGDASDKIAEMATLGEINEFVGGDKRPGVNKAATERTEAIAAEKAKVGAGEGAGPKDDD